MGMKIKNYSEKSFAVVGDTKQHKDKLKELGGRFNRFLKINEEKVEGWIFGKGRMENVKKFVASTNK